jgi:hypothetical protein
MKNVFCGPDENAPNTPMAIHEHFQTLEYEKNRKWVKSQPLPNDNARGCNPPVNERNYPG